MFKNIFSTLSLMLLPAIMLAQQPVPRTAEQGPPGVIHQQWLKNNPILQAAVIDTLNHRIKSSGSLQYMPGAAIPQLNAVAEQQFFNHVSNTYGARQLQHVKKGYELLKDTTRTNRYLDEKLRGFYALRNETNALNLMKAGAYGNQFKTLWGNAFYDNTPGAVAKTGFSINIEDNVVIGNIPVNISYTNISGVGTLDRNMTDQSLKKFSFDKAAYVERMNGYLNKSYDLRKYFLEDINVSAAVKSFATQHIENACSEITPLLDPAQVAQFRNLISAEQLVYLDSNQIKHLLLDNKTLQLNEGELTGAFPDTALTTSAHASTVIAARHYLSKVADLKSMVEKGLAAKETLSAQHALDNNVKQRMNDPEAQQRNIKELLPLNFIQRLLLQTKSLNVGNIAASGSKGGVSDLFMSGAQGSFLNKNKFLMMGLGNRNDGGSFKDQHFSSSLEPASYKMQFLQMGKGDITEAHSHVALVNANTSNQTRNGFNTQSLSRNIFVGAFSEQIDLGAYGSIAAEISKSNNEFKNAGTGNDYALASKTAAFTLMNDFWQTVSIGLDYTGAIDAMQLSQRAYVSYSGLGYSNPASPGASRGTVRYGLGLKKSWNKRRVTVGFKMDRQDMSMSAITDSKWKNSQYAVDTRIRVKKNFSLSARIAQSAMKNISAHISQTGYLNRQISVTSQLSGKMFDLQQHNNITLGFQQMDIYPLKSLLLNLNVNHSIVVNTHVLSVSMFYNKDIKDQALYGNLLTAETGWSYQLGKLFSCTSGLTYLDNKEVVQQVGVKQTVAANLFNRLNMNLYMDCRKNLLNTPQNYLFGNFSTQLALYYLLNK
ncbi:hypothetical protein [Chitinophaga niastensis]|nr:hypothetical protein [Chitinophaga niastensis]